MHSVVVDVTSPVRRCLYGGQMPRKEGIPPDCSTWRRVRVSVSSSWSWRPFLWTGAPLKNGCHCSQLTDLTGVVGCRCCWTVVIGKHWWLTCTVKLLSSCQAVLHVRVVGLRRWGDCL